MYNRNIDYSLYLVTDPRNASREKFYDKIIKAIQGGVTVVQLREKNIDDKEYIYVGKKVKEILTPYKIPLIINDNPHIAHEIGAEGVHLGQSDTSPQEARSILGPDAIIGISIENIDQAHEALRQQATNRSDQLDYLSISPIFSTPTKQDTAAPLGLEGLKQIRSLAQIPLLAIGGINETNLIDVFNAGADGVCVVSAIFFAENPRIAAQKLKDKINKFKQSVNPPVSGSQNANV